MPTDSGKLQNVRMRRHEAAYSVSSEAASATIKTDLSSFVGLQRWEATEVAAKSDNWDREVEG